MSSIELAAVPSPVLRGKSGFVLNPETPERRSEEEINAFFSENQPELERKIGNALDEVIGKKYSGPPAAIVGQKLLESEGIDVSLISPDIHEKPQGHELELLRIVSATRATALRALSSSDLQLRSPSPTPSTAPSEDGNLSWNMNAWIKSISTPRSIDEIVCDACLAPLREDRSELGGGSIEQEFIRQLGESDSHEMILRLLLTPKSNGSNVPKVLEEIARAIYIAAKKLNGETADAEEADEAGTPAASKFFEDGEGSLKFGEISTFYEGLDGFLGPPNPNLREAMENEHCKSADATAIFRVPNYYTHTTSELEYWFVVEPTQEKLEELSEKRGGSIDKLGDGPQWPSEQKIHGVPLGKESEDGADDADEKIKDARDARRQIMELSEYEAKMNEKNAQLREKDLDPLIEEELIAARLYTGPMYSKYNDVLRVIGSLRGESDEQQRHSSEELSEKLKEQQAEDEKKARKKEADQKKKSPSTDVQKNRASTMNLDENGVSITGNTLGNLYTTTLHVINSAVLKLGKLAKVQTVYRGIARRTMPKKMLNKGMDNARGGIEYGFSSASTKRHEAERYATKDKATTPVMLEITQGLIDRGADLEWLSQYPHEAEVLFPPLTGLEFLKFRVEDRLLIVTVRPSVNLHSLTIEKVIAKMKTSHLQLLDLLTEGLRFAGVPGPALQPLTNLKVTAEGRDPEYYNSTLHYRDVTILALDTQTDVFKSLLKQPHESGDVQMTDDLPDDSPQSPSPPACSRRLSIAVPHWKKTGDENNIFETAVLAARAGQHQTAIELLLRRQQHFTSEPTSASLKRIAEEILDGGCMEPWPATLVELVREKKKTEGLVLPIEDFKELVEEALSKQKTPFSEGEPVRVLVRETWMNARIHCKKAPPNRKSFDDETAIAKETEAGKLLRLNAALMKTMKEGTATRADREELEAVMKRKEELDKELGADKWSRECHEFIDKKREEAEEAKLDQAQKEAVAKAAAEKLVAAKQKVPPNELELLEARTASEKATKAADAASEKAKKAAEKAKPAKAAKEYYFDGRKYSGDMYEVEGHLGGDGVEEKHEEDVIALCLSGLPLVLCVAAQEGVPLVVKTLLDAKVSPYATDKNGSTALIRICSQRSKNINEGHYECIKHLLDATAEQFYHVRNLQRQNAFDLATRNKQCKTLYYMKPSSYPCTELGTKEDRERDERKFTDRGVWHDWAHDETWASGMSTLMVTLRFAHKDNLAKRVKTLLTAKADVNFKHKKGGSTALHMALVTEDLPEVVRLLLEAGADVNARHGKDDSFIAKGDGRTPLLQAAQAGHVEAAKVLIEYKADLFYKREARSILTFATQYGNTHVAEEMLKAAERLHGNARRKELLNMRGTSRTGQIAESALCLAMRYGHKSTCEMLLRAKIDVKYELEPKQSYTSLHRACANGHVEAAQLLLSHSPAHLNQKDLNNETSLMWAAKNGYTHMVRMLLMQPDIDLDVINKEGQNALWIASAKGHIDIVKVLIEKLRRSGKGFKKKIGVAASTLHFKGETPKLEKMVAGSGSQPFMPPPTAPGAHDAGIEYGVLAPDIAAVADQEMTPAPSTSEAARVADPQAQLAAGHRSAPVGSVEETYTALMAAAYYGHDAVVRALYTANPQSVSATPDDPSRTFSAAQGSGSDVRMPDVAPVHKDALLLATEQGHLQVVRAVVGWKEARGQISVAEDIASRRIVAYREAGNEAGMKLFEKISKLLEKSKFIRQGSMRAESVVKKAAPPPEDTPMAALRVRIANEDLKRLEWDKKGAFDGQLAPHRPNEAEIEALRTPVGPLIVEHGVVVQFGPYNSVWLRVGCVRRVNWIVLWNHLKLYIDVALEEEVKKNENAGAVYLAISVRSMQAVDFTWLAEHGFRFHHYRPPGHGMTPMATEEADASGDATGADLALHTAELVYYCWPSKKVQDKVPSYSTSIEGVSGLVFSRDGSKLLMVWERGAWSTPGGAVNEGESKIDALERELFEEVKCKVDRSWDGMRYLGGWQQQCARDHRNNDNFSVFALRCATEEIQADGYEIHLAYWVPWREILHAWRQKGRPKTKKVTMPEIQPVAESSLGAMIATRDFGAEKQLVSLNTLQWLDTYELQRGFQVTLKTEMKGPAGAKKQVTEAKWTA